MVLRLGRFFARSTTTTRVPIWGPSTVISENIPAVWLRGIFVLDAMVSIRLEGRRGWASFGVGWGEGRGAASRLRRRKEGRRLFTCPPRLCLVEVPRRGRKSDAGKRQKTPNGQRKLE